LFKHDRTEATIASSRAMTRRDADRPLQSRLCRVVMAPPFTYWSSTPNPGSRGRSSQMAREHVLVREPISCQPSHRDCPVLGSSALEHVSCCRIRRTACARPAAPFNCRTESVRRIFFSGLRERTGIKSASRPNAAASGARKPASAWSMKRATPISRAPGVYRSE